MTNLQKLRLPHVLKWVSFLYTENMLAPSKKPNLYYNGFSILQQIRFCSTERAFFNLGERAKKSRVARRQAQAALLEYLHSTRSLQFMDAENMSKNTPDFLERLLKGVEINDDSDIPRSLTRFLRYHPINEFEPFFESIGLSPVEYSAFLPRNLMFLNEDQVLLDNYYVLCNYGVARNLVGKIYKVASDVFRYENGELQLKLRYFQNMGLKQSLIVKIIVSSPCLLRSGVNSEFVESLGKLKKAGIGNDWLEEHINEGDTHDWKCILELLKMLIELGLSNEQLGELIKQHPDILLELSVRSSFCLFGYLSKFGFDSIGIQTVFLDLPNIPVVRFVNNLRNCCDFLVNINMDLEDIGRIVRSYPIVLGSCELKKIKSLLTKMNCGKQRLCQLIIEDPEVLKTWVLGTRVDKLEQPVRENAKLMRRNFLLNLGFEEKSKEMEKALKEFRGKAVELQERFDCLVNNGLSREEVIVMVKVSPQILNQKKDIIETKIDYFVNDLGYKVTDLVTHPAIVSYKMERVKLRLLMYKWLKDEQVVHPKLALSTLLSCSEDIFVSTYVKCHPNGIEFWKKLKKDLFIT